MIRTYLDHALRRASYSRLEDGSWCAEVRGLRGVIATGDTVEACRADLESVVEGWIILRVAKGLSIPPLDGARIRVPRAS
jgi:predicted RNase H-like HicB family nuclease